jgi:hypothetical protein
VIELANHALLTPSLFASLNEADLLQHVPGDVRNYLQFIHDRNRERNLLLRSQLDEAVAAFNSVGIVPILLKGAVPLFLSGAAQNRMTSDLDVAVTAQDEAPAQTCLEELGYVAVSSGRGMERPQDVGVLELRLYHPDDFGAPKLVKQNELLVKIPSGSSRAWHWMAHDMLKEGDYWRGRMDLRHMYDLAQLSEDGQVDWTVFRASLSDKSVGNAVDTQLLSLNRFFGTPVPADCLERPLLRFQHWRRSFASRHPLLGAPLRLAGNLFWGAKRLSRVRELAQSDPVQLVRRIAGVLCNENIRSKI